MNNEDLQKLSDKLNIPIKQLNRLNQDKWYHGTTYEAYQNILQQGILWNYNYGSQLDFGTGFYLTDSMDAASNYIRRVPELTADGNFTSKKEWCVIEITFNPFELLFEHPNKYSYCNFPKHDENFAKFVFQNRLYNVFNEKPHGIDIIWGVMSDSIPPEIILSYKNGEISYEEAIKKLQKPNSMKQLYIGNQEICNMLKITNIKYFKKED